VTDSFMETLISAKVLCIECLNTLDNYYKEKRRVFIYKHIHVCFLLIRVKQNYKYTVAGHV